MKVLIITLIIILNILGILTFIINKNYYFAFAKHIIYVFWTGTNQMNQNRLDGIESIKKITGVNVKLLNVQNLNDYI